MPAGFIETVIEYRTYARCKAALDAKDCDPWDTPMMHLVQEIEFDIVRDEMTHDG